MFGVLQFEKEKWFTMERPWLNNKNNVSCIPTGTYRCTLIYWEKHKKWVYHILDVPHRFGVLIHSANFPTQLLGCIALGEKMGIMDGKRGVFTSVPAVRRFNDAMNKEDFMLEVR